MLKSQIFFRGSYPGPPYQKGKGGRGGVGLGREEIGVWPTQKLSRGAHYALAECSLTGAGSREARFEGQIYACQYMREDVISRKQEAACINELMFAFLLHAAKHQSC
jgi:hypothetical protein